MVVYNQQTNSIYRDISVRVGVIQSSFIPWRGYFDFIASVDIFVFYDDVQYSKGSWRNRNKIKTLNGTQWLTVPVCKKSLSQLICDTEVHKRTSWLSGLFKDWHTHYQAAQYYDVTKEILGLIESDENTTISQLNIKLIRRICEYLDISTTIMLSTEFDLAGIKTDRLMDLLKKLKADTYLSGPSADTYLDKSAFDKNRIRLEYKSYDYLSYPQLWGEFIGEVTILDLIANCGPDSKNLIKSRVPDRVVIS